jgi:hypothetical protein
MSIQHVGVWRIAIDNHDPKGGVSILRFQLLVFNPKIRVAGKNRCVGMDLQKTTVSVPLIAGSIFHPNAID